MTTGSTTSANTARKGRTRGASSSSMPVSRRSPESDGRRKARPDHIAPRITPATMDTGTASRLSNDSEGRTTRRRSSQSPAAARATVNPCSQARGARVAAAIVPARLKRTYTIMNVVMSSASAHATVVIHGNTPAIVLARDSACSRCTPHM